jgi:hypothetical protein
MSLRVLIPLVLVGIALGLRGPVAAADLTPCDLARAAISEDREAAERSIDKLRGMGASGLELLMDRYSTEIRRHQAGETPASEVATWQRIAAAVDAVAGQRDAWSSGLYWYTDFDLAAAAARAQSKPILSLRLLGRLDEEYSCANSRFFRTVLYANADVSRALRERFVLHWKSVRPVPKITIDMGDGRVVQRTVTGNSIHYVLTADGEVVDGIPGLYGPAAFLREIGEAQKIVARCEGVERGDRAVLLRDWHAARAVADVAEWQADVEKIGVAAAVTNTRLKLARNSANADDEFAVTYQPDAVPAVKAAGRAVGKSVVELPVVKALADVKHLQESTGDAAWAAIAALHAEDARLDDGSKALMRGKHPDATTAARRALTKAFVEDPLLRVVRGFERSIAEDTVRNEYVFHRQTHEWLAAGAGSPGVDRFNARVYAELFLTPDSDPWLGLVPDDTYCALDNGGMCRK